MLGLIKKDVLLLQSYLKNLLLIYLFIFPMNQCTLWR